MFLAGASWFFIWTRCEMIHTLLSTLLSLGAVRSLACKLWCFFITLNKICDFFLYVCENLDMTLLPWDSQLKCHSRKMLHEVKWLHGAQAHNSFTHPHLRRAIKKLPPNASISCKTRVHTALESTKSIDQCHLLIWQRINMQSIQRT